MEEQLKTDFEKILKISNFSEKDIKFKKNYLNKFIENGFPSRKLENWKFLDLSQIIKNDIGELSFYNDYSVTNKVDTSIFIDGLEHNKIIFINGRIEKIDFDYEDEKQIEIFDDIEANNTFNNKNSLIDLNNAFRNKYYKIVVKKGYSIKKPLVIYHSTNEKTKYKNINLRLDFELEQNSSLKLIDFFNDISDKNFMNILYNFDLKKDSILKNYKIDNSLNKNLKYSFNNIDQEKNSISETFIFSAGSNYFKNEINCNLKGEYSSAFVNGIFLLKENQQHEIRSTINHIVENTKSYQLIKSVLGKNSKAAYQGRIYVDSKAQKTNGYQLSKAILLDETSEFNAKPELEIYADDVKCSHGSASGSLDENSIFYLMSRGLNYKQSKELLINGFMLDVVEKITDSEIKNLIKNMIGLKE
ncbi:MAG: SufD family Fe-S cluster assembly protein [Candidatus Pelagibacter sp. TMED106]|nr:MAG: SufD family Fe-S cluster assembly protein [Candidatus Pelagibacter sp. TMED106]